MRILWFTSTPSLAASHLNADAKMTGWVDSLEKHLSGVKDITLGVAFPFGYEKSDAFTIGTTTYFPVQNIKEKGKYSGIFDRWRHIIEPETIVNRYLDVINQFKPDLIHIFGSEAPFGLIINQTQVPVVVQIQGNLSVCTLKYFSGFSLYDSLIHSNKKSFILGYSTWHQYFTFKKRAARELAFMKACRFVIGRTDWDRSVTRIIAPGSRYFKCDEILRDPFYQVAWTMPEHNKFILFSTLSGSTYKGFETILLCADILKGKMNFDFEWHIAGIDESHEIISIIEKTWKKKFRENNVRFRGSMKADELVSNMLQSDCFVHPSHIENSPNSVCEAMMLGLPTIATRAGGTASIFTDGEDGILVQDGDPYSMAGAILQLSSSPDLKSGFSDKSRRKSFIRHDPRRIITDLIKIYNSIIES